MSPLSNSDGLRWKNLIDTPNGVLGIALVSKGYAAPLHHHSLQETYYVLHGSAHMYINGTIREVDAPMKITIDSDKIHALTPISDHVILLYVFDRGPFSSIEYKWPDVPTLHSRIQSRL